MSRPHYVGDFWKRSFFSTVGPTFHSNPSRKRSFISTLGHTFYTNPSRKRSFWTTLFNPNDFENATISFSCGWKTFKTELSIFENDDVTIIMWFPFPRFPQPQIQNGR